MLARLGLTPNFLTGIGLGLNVGAGAVIATGEYRLGAVAFLAASAFDALDGAVARAAGKATPLTAEGESEEQAVREMTRKLQETKPGRR